MTPDDLKKWMKKKKWTVEDVASAIHVSHRTIRRFLNKERQTRPIIINAIAQLVQEGKGND